MIGPLVTVKQKGFLVVSDFPSEICRGELPAVIDGLMSKCQRSGWN